MHYFIKLLLNTQRKPAFDNNVSMHDTFAEGTVSSTEKKNNISVSERDQLTTKITDVEAKLLARIESLERKVASLTQKKETTTSNSNDFHTLSSRTTTTTHENNNASTNNQTSFLAQLGMSPIYQTNDHNAYNIYTGNDTCSGNRYWNGPNLGTRYMADNTEYHDPYLQSRYNQPTIIADNNEHETMNIKTTGHKECSSNQSSTNEAVSKLPFPTSPVNLGVPFVSDVYDMNMMNEDSHDSNKDILSSSLNASPNVSLVKRRSCSRTNFAWQLAKSYFTNAELSGHNCQGKRGKLPLHEGTLNKIKEKVMVFYPPEKETDDCKEKVWRDCQKAIDKGIRSAHPTKLPSLDQTS